MFIAQALAREFVAHVTGCPSGIIACSARAAVESWFQVELASMLLKSNRFDSVQFGYDYPGGGKADLAAEGEAGRIIFELKCFVRGADSNKLEKWPGQLARLLRPVEEGHTLQGVALSTYYGYGADRISCFVKKFHPLPWNAAGPLSFLENAPLQLVVATAGGNHQEHTK